MGWLGITLIAVAAFVLGAFAIMFLLAWNWGRMNW